MLAGSAINSDLLLGKGENITCMLDTSEFIQQDILISAHVTLSVHCFGDGIDHEGSFFTIGKFHIIKMDF